VQALRLHHEVAGMMKSEQELREKLKGLLAMDADKISPTFIYSKQAACQIRKPRRLLPGPATAIRGPGATRAEK
jgi:hypothetical protein